MRFLTLAVILLGLGLSGYARADDSKSSASMILAQHGLSQVAQAAGCANTCQLPTSDGMGGATCPIPTATGSTCTPVGTGCNCSGQLINAMGVRHGVAVNIAGK
jgi:hypothetical protein